MNREIFEKARKIQEEIEILEDQLNLWKNADGIRKMMLYQDTPAGYTCREVNLKYVDSDVYRNFTVTYLTTKLNKLKKELESL